jgi:dihydroneopterin aldolase
MSIIAIEDMSFYSYHGCFKEEATIGTNFKVDLYLECNTEKAEKSDKVSDTVDYSAVYQVVKQQMEKPSHLLEAVARRIIESIKNTFPQIKKIKVKVTKLNPPLGGQIRGVSVCLSYEQNK